MNFLNNTLNYALDSGLLFGVAFVGTVGFIGYKFVSSYLDTSYLDKGIQTGAWEDYSDRPSQLASNSLTSIDTITPISENFSPTVLTTSEIGTQTMSGDASIATTVLPIPPVNIEMIPNPDIVQNIAKPAADYYSHIMWVQQSVDFMIDRAELINNLNPNMDVLEKTAMVASLF